ncbi:hypothetical protein ABZ990_27470 [Streptomyces sp. NPDC046203]|uniref:hypothetical protein n=1 Tax=Streptomyces sp. NPDC046203 TaxID=3154602 RepID=UPI0033D6B68F
MTAGEPVSPIPVAPAGLTRRARHFVEADGIRVPRQDIRHHRDAWIEHGITAAEFDRAVAFQDRWGGLALPPAPFYEGGPHVLGVEYPRGSAAEEHWSFSAGTCRVSMGHGFRIGLDGSFGIDANHWVPLHADVDGWVESLALASHAGYWAENVRKIKGTAVDALDLDGYEQVPEVQGVTDTWWRGEDKLIAVYRGTAVGFDAPHCLRAHIYEGLDEWGLHGG